MNKFSATTIGLAVFVAVAIQLALAAPPGNLLVSEVHDDDATPHDADDPLEGGIRSASNARHKVGIEMEDSFGVDVFDKFKNLPMFVAPTTNPCSKANHKDVCEVCCNGHRCSYTWHGQYELWIPPESRGCHCHQRSNSYDAASVA